MGGNEKNSNKERCDETNNKTNCLSHDDAIHRCMWPADHSVQHYCAGKGCWAYWW
jgi:hypothetical protein